MGDIDLKIIKKAQISAGGLRFGPLGVHGNTFR